MLRKKPRRSEKDLDHTLLNKLAHYCKLSQEIFYNDLELSRYYINQLHLLLLRYKNYFNTSIESYDVPIYCKKCFTILIPGYNSTFRLKIK